MPLIWMLILLSSPAIADTISGESLPTPGGKWTRNIQPTGSLIAPAQHLDDQQELAFWTGFSFFRNPWIASPASTTARDGLGPLFNAHSCEACHPGGGRGHTLLGKTEQGNGTVIRIGVLSEEGVLSEHPYYGHQLQTRSTYSATAEAEITLHEEDVGKLRKPVIDIEWGEAGPADDAHLSIRVAPALIGLGLLESIPVSVLQEMEDPNDKDGDGISGRIHWWKDQGEQKPGLFGWKARHTSVHNQNGSAFRDDIGITNVGFEAQPCTAQQKQCLRAPSGNDEEVGVEIVPELFDYVTFFTRHIPPPAAGKLTEFVERGRNKFSEIGCDGCHRPSYATSEGRFWPYTDLLLHDMGEELAEAVPEGDASGSEWRTPPLWGIGTMKRVAGHTTLLHDGRARSVNEAILWHGGEAAMSKEKYEALSVEDRRAVIRFINAL